MESADAVRRQFTGAAARYAGGTIMPDDAERLNGMLRHLQPALGPHASALDIATGAGHTAIALAPHVGLMTGIDLTPAMLAEASHNARTAGVHVEWREMDACELDYPDGAFDVVTCRYAPHHFSDLRRAVGHMRRVLKKGGMLYIYDNSAPDAPSASAFIDQIERLRDPSHGHSAPRSEWAELLTYAGFHVRLTNGVTGTYVLRQWFERAGTQPERRATIHQLLKEVPTELRSAISVEQADDGEPTSVTIADLHLEILAEAR